MTPASAHKWIEGTVIDIAATYLDTTDTRFTAFDYTVQVANRLYVIRFGPSVPGQIGSGFGTWAGVRVKPSSSSVPINVGEVVGIDVQGTKAWLLDSHEKSHRGAVIRQMLASQPTYATTSERQFQRQSLAPAGENTRPTLQREPEATNENASAQDRTTSGETKPAKPEMAPAPSPDPIPPPPDVGPQQPDTAQYGDPLAKFSPPSKGSGSGGSNSG